MKHHLWIVIAIATGFVTFMLGYSLPPFMEVGFGGGDTINATTTVDDNLVKQYEEMLKTGEE